MLIKGTSKIKGALDLTGISKQLVSGTEISITDEEFYDHTVQTALKMGMISHREGTYKINFAGKYINLKNIHNRAIAINALSADVRPGETFKLTEEQINNGDIRAALAKGLIQIMSSVRVQQGGETSVDIGDVFKETKPKQNDKDLGKVTDDYLETNEELKTLRVVEMKNVIDTETPDPVSPNDIEDPKGEAVVWNPNKDPVAHTPSKMSSVSISKDSEKHSPLAEENVDIDNIVFVDKEMDKTKRASHPKLKDRPEDENNDEIDFV